MEGSGEHLSYFVGELKKKNYNWGEVWLPHDANNNVLQAKKNVYQQMKDHFERVYVVERLPVQVGINL